MTTARAVRRQALSPEPMQPETADLPAPAPGAVLVCQTTVGFNCVVGYYALVQCLAAQAD
jgi:hypothetical protein